MYIGELAKRTGASPKAIRLYESLGLLGKVKRKGSYRFFSEVNFQQVILIRQARKLGFSLSEMQEVIQSGRGFPDWDKLLHQIDLKRVWIRDHISSMTRLEMELEQVGKDIRKCTTNSALTAERYRFSLDSSPRGKAHTL